MRKRFRRLSIVLFTLLALGVTLGAATPQAKSGVLKTGAAAGMGLGERPAPLDLSSATGTSVKKTGDSVYPASYDLRSLNRVTSVKDQGSHQSTQWAFTALGSLESCLMPGENLDFSEDNMLLNSGFDGAPYDDSGNIWMSTAYLVRWGGPVYESEDIYDDYTTPPGLTPHKHVQDVSWIPARSSSTDNDNIKYLLTTYGGVDVPMSWQGAANNDSHFYKVATHAYYCDEVGADSNHEVVVVGWNDNYAASNFATAPPGNGAFICKNSWGTGWGDSGYFYVSYYDTELGNNIMAAYNGAEATTNYARNYQYDPLGVNGAIGFSSETAWMANVYTATKTEALSAVGFYALAMGTSYVVQTGPSLGNLSTCASGTLITMGYHTVTIPTPETVTDGQPFVVAVRLTTPGRIKPLPIEYPQSDYSSKATASAGQSYISSDGKTWADLTTRTDLDPSYAKANVCLKAYTGGNAEKDGTAPTTSVSGIPSGWSKTPAKVGFTAADTGGSGVAYTEHSLDGGAYVHGSSVTVSANGTHKLLYRSADNAGNVEAAKTATVRVDAGKPKTSALAKVTVKKGKKATFKFRVNDVTPSAKVTIKIFKGVKCIKKIPVGSVATNAAKTYKWTCRLPKRSYVWKVYATDQAGNAQKSVGSKTLKVK